MPLGFNNSLCFCPGAASSFIPGVSTGEGNASILPFWACGGRFLCSHCSCQEHPVTTTRASMPGDGELNFGIIIACAP
ncbi:hypothetical protein V6N13_128256 [Hibiscus sabdariffa]